MISTYSSGKGIRLSNLNQTHLNICVIGCGAIGSLYGGMLSKAGATISIIKRDVLPGQNTSISVLTSWGDFTFKPAGFYSSLETAQSNNRFDLIIVSAKTLAETRLDRLVGNAKPQCPILLLQNGIHNEQVASKYCPSIRLMGGLAFVCVSRQADGRIYHQDYGRLKIGDYTGNNGPLMDQLQSMWHSVGVPISVTDNLNKARWEKLVWNAPFNPMSVLKGGQSTKEILENPESRQLVEAIMEEVVRLADADGVQLPQSIIQKNIENTLTMAPYKTSMLLDYEAGRPLELDAILGEALRIGEHLKIAVPKMKKLYESVRQIAPPNTL